MLCASQVHIAGLILSPIKNGKQSDVTYVNVIKHADEFDLPVVARRLFSDNLVRSYTRCSNASEHCVASCSRALRYGLFALGRSLM